MPPLTRSHTQDVCGVPTKFVLTAYSNRIFVLVSQTDSMGTLVSPHRSSHHAPMPPYSLHSCGLQINAEADRPLDPTSGSYTTRVLFGRRDDETLEVYARTLIELISRRAPVAGPLLLAISIREHSSDMFKGVMRVVEEQRVWG
jgi:proteasome assembly chaperone 3